MRKKAFTLMEVLIVLVFIGFISMLMLSVVDNQPTKAKVLAKKSYTVANQIVQELINDPYYYPESSTNKGFKNTTEVTMKDTGTLTSGTWKFATLVTNKLASRTLDESDGENYEKIVFSGASEADESKEYNKSWGHDGVLWIIERTSFRNGYATIFIDTNNKNKEEESCIWNACTCREPDVFELRVSYDGRVTPVDAYYKALVNSPNSSTKEFENSNPCTPGGN